MGALPGPAEATTITKVISEKVPGDQKFNSGVLVQEDLVVMIPYDAKVTVFRRRGAQDLIVDPMRVQRDHKRHKPCAQYEYFGAEVGCDEVVPCRDATLNIK